ncbi:MAG: hypothetical protein GDA48_03840 [Hormoscilla sp. GM102CHS1]|nr:hypothetical protein [Hormoscilla sp. GM102CHS1]
MKFLYPINSVQASAFNLQSASMMNRARGWKYWTIPWISRALSQAEPWERGAMLTVLAEYSDQEKLEGS